MPVKQLIVGWNRGGLGYIHELLQQAGQDVGKTFGPDITPEGMLKRLPKTHQFEVSPYVVPFLDHPELENVKVTFLLRDPLRIMNSLYFHGLFHNEKDSAVQRAAFRYLPTFKSKYKGKPAQAACSYLNNWFKLAKSKRKHLQILRIEDGPRILLEGLTGTPVREVPYVPPNVNASNCKQMIVPSKLPHQQQWGMRDLLIKLGYREWAWSPRGGHAHYVNADWHC